MDLGLIGLAIGLALAWVVLRQLNIATGLRYYPLAAFCFGFIGISSAIYVRSRRSPCSPGSIYSKILLDRESFNHGGGGSRIFGSLKLLLANAPSMEGREGEYLSLLKRE